MRFIKPVFQMHNLSSGLMVIWALSFLFFATMALLVQLVALPYFFPAFHAGNGLLVGGDWVGFNAIASELAERISREGWGAWELRPERQAPAGIAAVFYIFLGPHPWTLIAINSVVHASTVLVLVRIMQFFVPDVRFALICALPFILFPTSLIWYSQIHKDGTFFLGASLNLYGWILLSRLEIWKAFGGKSLLPILYILVGCFLIWVMRPYGGKLMQGIGCIFVIILTPYLFINTLRRKLLFRQLLLALVIIISLPIALSVFKDGGNRGEVTIVNESMQDGSFSIKAKNVIAELKWVKTDWVPRALDDIFLTLSIIRIGYASTLGGSNIDSSIHFRSVAEFFYYLPRAIQIGFAAPFPSFWNEPSINGGSVMFKRIVVVEIFLVYLSLFFLIYALIHWRKRIETWFVFIFCTLFILLYTYITPNIGSLHRTRHGFLMMLMAFGIAGGIAFWQTKLSTIKIKPRSCR